MLHKVKVVLIALVVLGLIGSGAGLVAHRLGAQQPGPAQEPEGQLPPPSDKRKPKGLEEAPRAEADKPEKRPQDRAAILKARAALGRKGYQGAWEGLGQTSRFGNLLDSIHTPENVYTWSVRWLRAERDLNPKHEDQVAALEAHVKRMKQLKEVVESLTRGRLPATKLDDAEWYLLEAELWLLEAKTAKK